MTEEHRRERLRLRREKDRARRRTKKLQEEEEMVVTNRRLRETAPGHSQRLKRGDENELERNLRLEKVASCKQLRLAMEKESKTGEDDSNHTAQVGPGDRGRKKSKKKRNGFDLDLILDGMSSLAL